jgi:hypothetical protein
MSSELVTVILLNPRVVCDLYARRQKVEEIGLNVKRFTIKMKSDFLIEV